jgi:hypothetical protein
VWILAAFPAGDASLAPSRVRLLVRSVPVTMVASVVTYTVQAGQGDELNARVQEHLVPAARDVAGYRGMLLLDQGDNRRLALLLFETLEHARAAQHALTPVGSEHTYALMDGPALGSLGAVVVADGVFTN